MDGTSRMLAPGMHTRLKDSSSRIHLDEAVGEQGQAKDGVVARGHGPKGSQRCFERAAAT